MKLFVAGASGAIGRRLVPALVAAGHAVTGLTRTPAKVAQLQAMGADAALADALDRDALRRAVLDARPATVIHEMTALAAFSDLRHFARQFEATNRLRIDGTRNLIDAAREAGARRFIAQSYAGWPFARSGSAVKDEDAPLDPDPPPQLRAALEAIRFLEQATLGAAGMTGIVLRYGGFYGPGTSLAPGEPYVEAVRRRRFPLVGGGHGIWSFIHIEDAAAATAAAVERGAAGIYHIVDDEPAAVAAWLPFLAATLEAEPPRRIPAWLARFFIGEAGVILMTEARGASNAKAKRTLGWQPRYPSWRDGFRSMVQNAASETAGR